MQNLKILSYSKSKIVYSEKLPGDDPKRRKPDITKARKILNWQPKIKLNQGLINMIKFNN